MRIVVAMSGGVDSSVAAALLAEQGHNVIGVSMQLYDQSEGQTGFGTCCTIDDLYDARRVASRRKFRLGEIHRQQPAAEISARSRDCMRLQGTLRFIVDQMRRDVAEARAIEQGSTEDDRGRECQRQQRPGSSEWV